MNKKEFEKEIEMAISKETKLWSKVKCLKQFTPGDLGSPTTVNCELQIAINGAVDDLEQEFY